MTKLICGWCKEEFEATIYKSESGDRNILICPHCSARLPSSRKESTGSLVGTQHIHTEWKNGDIV